MSIPTELFKSNFTSNYDLLDNHNEQLIQNNRELAIDNTMTKLRIVVNGMGSKIDFYEQNLLIDTVVSSTNFLVKTIEILNITRGKTIKLRVSGENYAALSFSKFECGYNLSPSKNIFSLKHISDNNCELLIKCRKPIELIR